MIAILILCHCQAQNLIRTGGSFACNIFVVGDKLTSSLIETPSIEYRKGTNLLWDMRNQQVIKRNIPCSYYLPTDSTLSEYTAKIQNSTSTYYKLVNHKIYRMGIDNHTTSLRYEIPEAIQTSNITLGDELNGQFSYKGIYADKDSILIFGDYSTEVYAKGTLLTPEENTLQNVLLQHTKKDIYYCINHNDTIRLTMFEDKWFAPGYRYPIIESRNLKDAKGNCIEDKTYYTPQKLQILNSYHSNKELTPLQNEKNEEYHTDINTNLFHLRQKSDKIELEYYNDKDQMVAYGIDTNDGIVIFQQAAQWHEKGLINKVIYLDLSKNSTYIFYIELRDKKLPYKFIAK